MTQATGRQPIETLRERLRSYNKRIRALERRPLRILTGDSGVTMVAVATAAEMPPDTDSAVYVVDSGTVTHQGVTHTLAEWQAIHGP